MVKTGKTTGSLKMRPGPGLEFEPPIAYLVPDTALEILEETADWLRVKAAGKEGWVGRKYVAIHTAPEPAPAPAPSPKSTMTEAAAAPKPARHSLRPTPTPAGMTRQDDDEQAGSPETQGKIGLGTKPAPKAPTSGHETAD